MCRHAVTAKEDLGKAVLAVYIAEKDVLATLYHYNKMERFSFKSVCVIPVANHLKGHWFIVLH